MASQISVRLQLDYAGFSLDLDVQLPGKGVTALYGPSGSGKTTCLRLIAGFEQPSAGSIRIHGEEAAGLPPYQRDVNTVFQDYALFPHMNVRDNVAYGLKVKGIGKTERLNRAEEALGMVALGGYGERKPVASSPWIRIEPALGCSNPAIRRRHVVLPEPEGPSMEKNSPSWISMETRSTAFTSPN